MPQNRKRKPRNTLKTRASNTRQTPPALSLSKGERQEMTGYDRETEISLLSSRQRGALPVLVAAPTIAHAARDCRVSEPPYAAGCATPPSPRNSASSDSSTPTRSASSASASSSAA